MVSRQAICLCYDQPMLNPDLSTQCTKSFDMLIYGTQSNIASSRQRYLCPFVFAKQSSQQIIGSSDFFDIIIFNCNLVNTLTADPNRMSVNALYPCAYALHCLNQYPGVAYIRYVFYQNSFIRHNCCCQYRQCCILRTTNLYLAN